MMVGRCLLCILIIPRTIRYPRVGPKMPLPFPSLFNNSSVPTFLVASDERKPLDWYWYDFAIG
ncbi:MAG: hypothetical protein RMY28_000455 [Nostoc sp. ChiSLP01]|nr:hypothetical protein [Nostoc sp. CmiSLP01]MDZ8283241.1 hypothetical protein [Nostoc sp. ChiSLP01]